MGKEGERSVSVEEKEDGGVDGGQMSYFSDFVSKTQAEGFPFQNDLLFYLLPYCH